MSIAPLAESAHRARLRPGDWIALLLTGIGLTLSVVMALLSDGVYHADDLQHLQFARWTRQHPQFLLSDWGRPGFTVLYALPAQLGWTASRIFSGLLTAATAWIAYRIARRMKLPAAALVPALLWIQPLTFSLSYTTLTEPVLAFYLVTSALLLLRGQHRVSAAVMSLCAVTRHEALIFLPIWIWAACRYRGAVSSAWLLLWAPLAHNLLNYAFLDTLPAGTFLAPKPTDFYAHGNWLTMTARWLEAAGPALIMLAAAGAPALWSKRGGKLLLCAAAAYLLAHTVIYRFGLFASGGYARFLVPIGPVVALSAAAALSEAFAAVKRRHAVRRTAPRIRLGAVIVMATCAALWLAAESEIPAWLWWGARWPVLGLAAIAWAACGLRKPALRAAAVIACPLYLIGIAIAQPLHQCRPHVLQEEELMVREATDWLKATGLDARKIVTASVWVEEFLGLERSPFRPRTRELMATMRPGDLLVWDVLFSPQPPHDLPLSDVRRRHDLVELWHGGEHSRHGIYCYVFEKRQSATTKSRGG
ncbi:MAG: DUF2029 domain-containing protein [Planctomycetes bacterium]|nr:DUF2029 domain-containing protein [Planctomycetota bacterium]